MKNEQYPLAEKLKFYKRGMQPWHFISQDDNPLLFNTLENILGYTKVYEITEGNYIPF